MPGKPVVLEVLWEGDTHGWYLCITVYKKSIGLFRSKLDEYYLGRIIVGKGIKPSANLRLTEAFLADEYGKKAIAKYGLIFYFPSPDKPDDDCPKWTERHMAIHCGDCEKLIIPTNGPYLPKDICYNCHLKREYNF